MTLIIPAAKSGIWEPIKVEVPKNQPHPKGVIWLIWVLPIEGQVMVDNTFYKVFIYSPFK